MNTRPVLPLLLLASGALGSWPWNPSPLSAQSEVSVQVGGSRVSPPTDVEGESAGFLVGGLQASHYAPGGSGVMASLLVGKALDATYGGDFLSGVLGGTVLRSLGSGWSGGMEIRGFGFRVEDPFPYRSLGLEGGPLVRFTNPFLSATLKGLAGVGRSETELRRTGRYPNEPVTDELWRYGGSGELLAGSRSLLAGVAAGIHESPGGSYRSAGLRLLAVRGDAALELRMDRWSTPLGGETTGGLALVLPLGGWDLKGFLGRAEPDPLTLTEPDGGSAGVLVGRPLWTSDPLPPHGSPLYRVVATSRNTATVEVQLSGPEGTDRMELVGDFTLWEPVPMQRRSSQWFVVLEIPSGTHHFGFFADGTWFLPDDAPDSVPDEWGRMNATMVIDP